MFLNWALGGISSGFNFPFFTMFSMIMIGYRNEEKGYSTFYDTFFRESLTHSENRLTAFLKKAKFIPGFKPGSSRQNAVALPLAPPPLQFS